MPKIVVTQDLGLSVSDKMRLQSLGELKIYDTLASSPEEWFDRCKDYDIICTGKFGLKTDKVYELQDVFISLPFVGVGFLDKERLKRKNITVSYCPGCNKDAVSEWIIGMMIDILRNLPDFINVKELPKGGMPKVTAGLTGKKVTILGRGNIGARVGKICKVFDMDVSYFTRGDDLKASINDADVIVNSLSLNPTTKNILDNGFFTAVKKGSFFISITGKSIMDTEAMIRALDSGTLMMAAIDAGGIQVGDTFDPYYQQLVSHPKILVTPHIAYCTDVTKEVANSMMIDNIQAWLEGKPINLI